MQKIFVFEDEKEIADVIVAYLEQQGSYNVEWYNDGPAGLESFKQNNPPDLVILDIMLPGMDGLDICREIRKVSKVPIIMLTALDEEIDKVTGLELGADDYVTKPFSPRELLARVRTILRRTNNIYGPSSSKKLNIEKLSIDQESHEVTYNNHNLNLTPSEYEILLKLVQHPNRVFSRGQFLETIQGEYFEVYERAIDSHIKNLRKKIASAGGPCLIKTVQGFGYKLVKEE